MFENLAYIADTTGNAGAQYEFDDEDQMSSSEVTAEWGRAMDEALSEGRVCRSVTPTSNDGSLSMGVTTYLVVTPTGDIYDDMGSEEQRFSIFEGDPNSDYYGWFKEVAEFFSNCGGFSATES